ncbi:helix-turn-helix transcriptional regulator [Streptomyces sp. NPDC003077]|uniref:helix-turn-helix domain-containing protein n=1 Tax=Streptomyces sp. NPDC003077 TaxID=3154443 RepID=UPI0033B80152
MRTLFGHRLRLLRKAAGMTQEELGARVCVHSTRITQIERATATMPTLALTRLLDEAVGAGGLLVDLWPHMYRENFPDWSRAFMEHAAHAVAIKEYAAHTVPGLLQTADYARAVLRVGRTLRSPEQIEERLAARMDRQERLASPDKPELWAVLDEAVLLRPVGNVPVMHSQLAHLAQAAEDKSITLQVLPFSQGEHQCMGGSLTVLTLPNGSRVAYTEGADYGQLIEDPEEVKSYVAAYDHLRALALPPVMSLGMIRSVMEGSYRASLVPSQPERRYLARQQLQQPGGWQLRRDRCRHPRRRPRP